MRMEISHSVGKGLCLDRKAYLAFIALRSVTLQPKTVRRVANLESESIAKNGKVGKTLSVLLDSRTESRFAHRISRSPGKKVRACSLREKPIPGSACRFRRACTWSKMACHAT